MMTFVIEAVTLLLSFLEVYLFANFVFELKLKKLPVMMFECVAVIAYAVTAFFSQWQWGVPIRILMGGALFFWLVEESKFKKLLIYLFSMNYVNIIFFPVSSLVKVSLHSATYGVYGKLAVVMVDCAFLLLLLLIKRRAHLIMADAAVVENWCLLIIWLCGFLSSGAVSAGIYLEEHELIPEEEMGMMTWSMTTLAIIFCIFGLTILMLHYRSVVRRNENQEKQTMLDAMAGYYEQMKINDREIRRIKHDFSEHMAMISEQLEEQQYDAARQYVDSMITKIDEVEKSVDVSNIFVSAILNRKRQEAAQRGIRMTVNGSLSNTLVIENYDLCTIFANLLNNAIEYYNTNECEEKDIKVLVSMNGGTLCIEVVNTISHKVTSLETKKDDSKNHGLGIENVYRTVKRYQGDITIQSLDNTFSVFIMLEGMKKEA